jgi:hypothetical protein
MYVDPATIRTGRFLDQTEHVHDAAPSSALLPGDTLSGWRETVESNWVDGEDPLQAALAPGQAMEEFENHNVTVTRVTDSGDLYESIPNRRRGR